MTSIAEKKCKKCNVVKSINSFCADKSKKDGIKNICNSCNNAITQKWRDNNRERDRSNSKKWRDNNLEKSKDNFSTWLSENKEKFNEAVKSWRLRNKDREKQTRKVWRERNHLKLAIDSSNRRARIKGVTGRITKTEWINLCERYKNKCLCCGREDMKLTIDHIVPISLGGLNIISNIQPLCSYCNNSKGAKVRDYRN